MAQWLVKNLSKLTGVSVQTLHHYDRIDLLKPSARLPNGYRLYSEEDLLQLQQIISLKFFGFKLAKIKELLSSPSGALEHFAVQARLLEKKAENLLEASTALQGIVSDVDDNKSIPWESIIKSIEVYQMTQEIENTWVKDIFTTDELKEYSSFKAGLTKEESPNKLTVFMKAWPAMLAEVQENIDCDPLSESGITLGRKCMEVVNAMYGKEHAHLRTKMFEQGFGEGKGLDDAGLTPEAVAWLEKAINAYWRDRIYGILAQVGKASSEAMLAQWDCVLEDMYGNEVERKKSGQKTIYQEILKENQVSKEALAWLKELPQ